MNKERLLHLIEILKKVPEEKFDIRTWGRSIDKCGMAACAGGWAAMDKQFNEEGLCTEVGGKTFTITYKQLYGYSALECFFDLTTSEVHYIFNPLHYPPLDRKSGKVKPADVIARIESLLNNRRSDEQSTLAPFGE